MKLFETRVALSCSTLVGADRAEEFPTATNQIVGNL